MKKVFYEGSCKKNFIKLLGHSKLPKKMTCHRILPNVKSYWLVTNKLIGNSILGIPSLLLFNYRLLNICVVFDIVLCVSRTSSPLILSFDLFHSGISKLVLNQSHDNLFCCIDLSWWRVKSVSRQIKVSSLLCFWWVHLAS